MAWILQRSSFDQLLSEIQKHSYELVGPTLTDEAIVYGPIASTADLPIGWTDEQDGGTYRLKKLGHPALFGYAVGPHSWKKYLHPPVRRLWQADRQGKGYQIKEEQGPTPAYAFIGVRACEIQAIRIQDRVFLEGPHVDPSYQERREHCFILAINCSQAGGTCFCVSMAAGPKVENHFDLALTEIIDEKNHYFMMESGSELGEEVCRALPLQKAKPAEEQAAEAVIQRTKEQMGRQMDTSGIKELLSQNYKHPRWEDVADRCLSCANCTMVCPTCFCTTVEDVTDLTGEHAERWQKWDSCFTMDFSYLNGAGSVRQSTLSRYRQWMTHKLSTWIDQFGSSGCVGCGRCITWCPVGIDLTEEVAAIRKDEK